MYWGLARKLTSRSNHKQHHHAAILTLGGAIVAVGYNRGREHAEAACIRKYGKRNLTPRHKLYSFRWAKSGKWANAKPCDKCAKLLGRTKVYYTDAEGRLVRG